MTEKSNNCTPSQNKSLFNIYKTPVLCSKIKKKMKNYRMTNFNFVLENKIEEPIDLNYNENHKHNQNLSTDENDKNKAKNNNNFEKFLNISAISDIKCPQIENKYNPIFQNNNFSFEKENSQYFDLNQPKKNNDPQYFLNKYEKKRKEENGIKEREKNDVNLEMFQNKDLNYSNNNIFLGKKTKNVLDEKYKINPSYALDEGENNKKINMPKSMILKFIDKYSFQFIFNLILKIGAKNIPEKNNDDKEMELQIENLIKEFGIDKIITIILSIGNSEDNHIQKYKNDKINKNEIKSKEKVFENDNDNMINLDEEKQPIDINNEIIELDEGEIDNKKENNNIIYINEEESQEEMTENQNNIGEIQIDNKISDHCEKIKNRIYYLLNSSLNKKEEISHLLSKNNE